jgi:zinc protease
MNPHLLRLAAAVSLLALTAASPRVAPPVVQTLPNGMRVVVFVRPGLPIVQAQLQASAGLRAEAKGHAGLAFLTAQLLRQGTTSRSAQDFATELDTLGATFGVSVNRDAAQVAAGCRSSELESLLELMSDAIVNPLFSDEAFEAMRRQVASQLGTQAQNPIVLADERAAALAFGLHPYGHPTRGDLMSLLGATRDQVSQFHRDRWRPDGAVLAIAGDVDPARVFAAASEWFSRWGGKNAPDPAPVTATSRTGTLLLDLPGSPATEIRAFALAPGRGAPGYASWLLATSALEAGGLPPGARATLSSAHDASLFMVSMQARPESAGVVVQRVRASLSAFASGPPRGDALAKLRRRAAGNWPLTIETHGQLLSTWLAGDAAGLPAGHLAAFPESLASATPEAAARSLGTGVTVLLSGPAERMKRSLSVVGRVDTVTISNDAAAVEAGVQVSPEQRKKGRQLVDAAVVAHGGAAKLKAVRNSFQDGELHMQAGGRELTGEMRFLRQDPDRLVYTTRFLDFEHRQVLDGRRGWALSMAGDSASVMDADTTTLFALRAILASDLVHLLRDASDPASDPISQGAGEVAGKPVDRVDFVSPHIGRTRLSLDRTSRRIVTVETQPTPQGAWRDRRQWSEYAQSGGLWWPRYESREVDGEAVSTIRVRNLVVNGAVDSTLFRRPIVVRGQIRGVE